MTDAEKKPCCCAAEPAEKDTAPSCCRHKDRTPEEYRALANRLSRIEGQVRGIRAMLDEDMEEERRLFYVAMTRAKTPCMYMRCGRGTIKRRKYRGLCGSIWGGSRREKFGKRENNKIYKWQKNSYTIVSQRCTLAYVYREA